MTSAYITPDVLSMIRGEVDQFLVHRYTRESRVATSDNPLTPLADEGTDSEGLPIYTFAAPQASLPCLYQHRRVDVNVGPNTLATVETPVLVVPGDDPLAPGDRITNITTRPDPVTGAIRVLLVGPVFVDDTTEKSPNAGGPLYIEAKLREIEVVG